MGWPQFSNDCRLVGCVGAASFYHKSLIHTAKGATQKRATFCPILDQLCTSSCLRCPNLKQLQLHGFDPRMLSLSLLVRPIEVLDWSIPITVSSGLEVLHDALAWANFLSTPPEFTDTLLLG